MTQEENSVISTAMLVFATATEAIMRKWLHTNSITLTGENKMIHNGMKRSVKQAMYYYERFNDKMTTASYEIHEDVGFMEDIRYNASDMTRIALRVINLYKKGVTTKDIEDMLIKMAEDKGTANQAVSDLVIESFKIK